MLEKINKDDLIIWIMIFLIYLSILFIIYLIIPFIFSQNTNLSNLEVLLISVASLALAFFVANKIARFIYLKFFTDKKS